MAAEISLAPLFQKGNPDLPGETDEREDQSGEIQ